MNRILAWFLIALIFAMSGPLQAATMASARGFEKSLYGRSAPWADKYAYCGGDPIGGSDPDGLQPQMYARLFMLGVGMANEAYNHFSGNYEQADAPENNRVTLPNGVTLWEGGGYQRMPVQVQLILSAPDLAPQMGPALEAGVRGYVFSGRGGAFGGAKRPGNLFGGKSVNVDLTAGKSLPPGARVFTDAQEAFKHLEKYHGIDPVVASARLHQLKPAAGRGAADNVLFDRTGNIYDPVTRGWLGSLTAGGRQRAR